MARIYFPGQQEGEQINLLLREHWFYLMTKMIVWLIFLAILVLFNAYVPNYLPQIFAAPFAVYVDIFRVMCLIFVFLGIFMTWALYYLNIQIITTERVVDISQDSLFKHTISELTYDAIEDVTGETKGIFGTMLSFGNVYVQTAAERERFEFKNVPHPEQIEKMILDLSASAKRNRLAANAPAAPEASEKAGQ